MAPSLLSRLYQDLAELHDSPYPGVHILIDDANVRELCLILTPPSGPWKNLSLHFDVRLPDEWPSVPPVVSSSVHGIDHPNLFGSYVCCDLLKQKYEIYRGDGYNGGYTPALTLRGLFLQFLTFFSSTKVEQQYGGHIEVGDCTLVRYTRDEADLPRRNPAARSVIVVQRPIPGQTLGSYATQDMLAAEWERRTVKPQVVRQEMTKIGPLREVRKGDITRIEERNYRWTSTYSAISDWKCKRCAYGSDAIPHCIAAGDADAMDVDQILPLFIPPATCKLDLINDDVLYEMALRLPSESVISFSIAYPRLYDIVQSMHILLQRELRCFFLRTPLSESVLGIGIAFDFNSRTLSSDFDWLSLRAYSAFGVRESIEKREFTFFLPLAFSRPHFQRVLPDIWAKLEEIDKEVQRAENKMNKNARKRAAGPPRRAELVGVVYKMMNNIVVSLMKSCDSALDAAGSSTKKTLLHASEKAVVAYCHLFHLVICLCRSEPSILREVTNRLRRFIEKKDNRTKTHVPDLGELIILIMLVVCLPPVGPGAPIQWSTLVGAFLEEVIIRNVRWVLKDAPHLEVMEKGGASTYRLAETFFRSKTSLRLVMFQISFLDLFFKTYASNLARLDNNYGFPEKELPETMVQEIKEIYKVNTWPAFFTRVRFPQGVAFGKDKFSDMLRDAVKTSAARRYHNPSSVRQLGVLQGQRKRVEEDSPWR
ncbi:hypothetical protein C8F04DRAFT_503819 [Mycena alexandri]|uniref:UBC core domain-containing protein n=1 Tax=Mycena alexandri TaxID=1745969 RepID=A0AAD6RWM0_9AGAR|nr:hypothetical protein C8F04DRAFT_503819 [Mycena alexandri]